MAISFTLNLSPTQIEFLQHLDLYASHIHKDIGMVPTAGIRNNFVGVVGRLIREGLVLHDCPPGIKTQQFMEEHRYYRITDKGRSVLQLIESDVDAFILRQQDIRRLKSKKRA